MIRRTILVRRRARSLTLVVLSGVGLIGLLLLSATCSSSSTSSQPAAAGDAGAPEADSGPGDASGTQADAADADSEVAQGDVAVEDSGEGGTQRANVVFILTDDLSWNLVQYMPHVQQMQKQGLTFSNYFVTDSLCCPSRSSIFTGKYPHNTGVFSNSGDAGGYPQFEHQGNATQTFAAALAPSGYQTAMMGKYLNLYVPKKDPKDPGWVAWQVAGEGGYGEYNYDLNQNGTAHFFGDAGQDYLTDVLSGLATSFLKQVGSSPFLLEVATFAPHAPYIPAPRHVGTFNEKLPRKGAFDTANTSPPEWLAEHPALTDAQISMLDGWFNLRVEAVQAVDEMIGTLMDELASAKLDKNTYFVFSSDNGYHMGDHMLMAGKETAFDSDIKVPLIVVGPGVPAGVTEDRIVENIDLCPTFAEMAGATAVATADGHSLVGILRGQTVSDWRNVALIEHHGPDLETMDPTDPDNEDISVRPNSYEALRMPGATYVEYQDGEKEYYDLASDPYQMTNAAAGLSAAQIASFHKTLFAIRNCKGAADCWKAQKM